MLLHLLQFEKEVYENIHGDDVGGTYKDFLTYLTQEGIADGVGTKQSTIYKELQTLRVPVLTGEDPLIRVIDKVRIPGRERACAIYFLTPYGLDLAVQKRTYLENKNLEVSNLPDAGPDNKIITIVALAEMLIMGKHESEPIRALLQIAASTSTEGKVDWVELISPTLVKPEHEEMEDVVKPKRITQDQIENPYFNRMAIKDPKYFFGRGEEILYIMSLLRNSQSCSIVGPRRIGKSSLINYVSSPSVLKEFGLNPNNYIFVSIDLEGLGDLTQSDFFYMIVEELRNRTTEGDTRKQMENLLSKDKIRFLDLKNIFKEITTHPKNVVFLFDEFELITNNKNLDSNFFSGLRNLANSYNVSYITATYVPLLQLTLSKETLGSPFFNFFTQVDLGVMDDESIQALITGPSRENGVVFSENIVDFITNTAGPHPFFIQMLSFHIFNWLKKKGSISEPELQAILKRFNDEVRAHFQYFWNHLSLEEQEVLEDLCTSGAIRPQINYSNLIQDLMKKALLIGDIDNLKIFSDSFEEFIFTTVGVVKEVQVETKPSVDKLGTSIKPKIDEPKHSKKSKKIRVVWGNTYFIDENTPTASVNVFNELTGQNIPGLFITRTPVNNAESQWNLTNSKVIWLCSRLGEEYLPPVLGKVSHIIIEFIKQNKSSVILLDGLEFIINNNDFSKTLHLMDNLKEMVAINNSILFVPMSSTMFSERELALLRKNCIEIPRDVSFD